VYLCQIELWQRTNVFEEVIEVAARTRAAREAEASSPVAIDAAVKVAGPAVVINGPTRAGKSAVRAEQADTEKQRFGCRRREPKCGKTALLAHFSSTP